jgi:pimeloyl-ACP methyl ester carboxylesterase
MRKKKRLIVIICGFIALFLILAVLGCGLFIETIPKGEIPGKAPEDRYVMIDHVNYHYREYPGPGRDVFLLHGFASSTYTWEKVVPYLTARGYHVWTLDMKGAGWSDKPKNTKYDVVTLMEEVNRWMDVMGLRHVVFAGNSLGGAVALLMALDHPDKTDRLILIDSAGYPIKKPLLIRLAKMPFSAHIARLFFGRWVVKSALKEVFYNDALVTEGKIDAYFSRLSTENSLYAKTALARSLDFDALSSYTKRIPKIKNRTLIVWGKEDAWIPLESGYRFSRGLVHSKLVILAECGHVPQEEKPEETAKIMNLSP